MKKNEKFFGGIIALMSSQVIIKILGLIYSIYLTNRDGFGDSGNAIYMSGYQIYALLLAISSIGVPNAISKLISEKLAIGDRNGADKIFKTAVITFGIIGFAGTFFLFIFSDVISNKILQIPEAEKTLMMLSPAIFFVSVSSVFRGYFNGKQEVSQTAKSQMIEQIFKTLFTILIVETVAKFTHINTELMAAGANLATTMATIVSFFYILSKYIFNRKHEKKLKENNISYKRESTFYILNKILAVSIPISVSSLIAAINKNIDSITVVRILKPLVGEANAKIRYGILSSKVDLLVAMPLAFNIAISTSLVPIISSAKIKNDIKAINKKLKFSIFLTILIGLPCTFGMFIYSKQILDLLFPNASSGSTILAISSFSIIFALLTQTINGALQGIGKACTPAIALLCGAITKLICNIILIRQNGIYENGAAIGNVMCNMVAFTIVYKELKKSIKLDFEISQIIIKPLIFTIAMCVCSYYIYNVVNNYCISQIATIIGIITAIIVYSILCFIWCKNIILENVEK